MSASDTKLDPAAETAASTEPQLAKTETELATNPVHGDAAKEEPTKEESAEETPAGSTVSFDPMQSAYCRSIDLMADDSFRL